MKNNSHIVDRKPDSCPLCQGRIVPIIYGLFFLESQTVQKAMKGELILGGCVISPGNDPKWACKNCGTRFLEDHHPKLSGQSTQRLYQYVLNTFLIVLIIYIIISIIIRFLV
ncbi:hypothetical protein [Elizabethkingia anophelis]|uniref:hypothetical protein n=1 Tax=Elizabethkingia anophelis TaxID=1117645 RepID=UPI00293D1024|nr:hypothetical protein [Elizabethkingia anophelis]